MLTTLVDRRPQLWQLRRAHLDRLAMLQLARSGICGCVRCNDTDRGEQLDQQIRVGLERVAYLGDQITERSSY